MTLKGMFLTLVLTLGVCGAAALFGQLLARRREFNFTDWVKVVIVVLLHVVQFPLIFLFYMVRSAWQDAPAIGWFLRPRAMCKHGVDRNRAPCQPCRDAEEEAMIAEMDRQTQQAYSAPKN